MGRASGRKLKVFQAQFGFYDSVVAAPSQAAALRAWGIHQNLFASGEARLATDEAAATVALEHPLTPLRRALGSRDPFALQPANLPKAPDPPKRAVKATATAPAGKPASAPSRPEADRSKLTAAEAALRDVDERRNIEEAAFARELDALEAKRSAAQDAYVEARKQASAALGAARAAYRKDGGAD